MSNPHGVFVEFYQESVEFKAESEKEGRPIFKEIDFIRIQTPGDRNNILEVKATDHYKQKFAREYAAYKSRSSEGAVGTILSQWPQITKSQVKEAEYFNVKTVEQLSTLNDNTVQRMGMGWMELRNKAKAYIDAASGSAETTRLAAENERLRADFEALKEQLMGQPEAPKRGRKPREAVDNVPDAT